MRRLVFPTIVAIGLVMVGSSSASAEDPTPAPTVSAKSTPGKKLCKIADPELAEISGIATTKAGYAVVNDGRIDGGAAKIYFLNRECEKVKEASFDGTPLDAEDIVLSPDGQTLWIADIGDNNVRNDPSNVRPHVALWSIPVSGNGEAVIHRVKYPDKDKHDAEALIFDGDGTPLIVTKEIGAAAGIYKPSAALKKNSNTPVPLERVGEIRLSATETAGNPVARIGNKTITGGAVTKDVTKVVLRTYTDAVEWDVTGGDVIAALKKEPRTTGLPNEPLGEAIAYSNDGKLFYTVSDMSGVKDAANHIREYTPATTVAAKSAKSADADGGGSWYSDLSIDDVTYIVGGIGVLGLILVGAGVFGIMRFRKSPQGRTGDDDDDLLSGSPRKGDPETELIGVGGAPQRGAGYGAGGGGGRPGGGPVYGAQSGGPAAGGPQRGKGVYGGGGQGGGGKGGSGGGGPQYARPAGQPPRGPQQAPARNPQQAPARNPQQAPARNPQQAPARNPQQAPARNPQQAPPRSPQQAPPRNPQQAPPRNPQAAPRGPQQVPGRGGAQQPPRGPQQAPARGPQQPPRGPQQGGGGGGVYGGQQPPRGPQGHAPGTYGGRPQGPDGRR
ncbi:hypothetical protein AB0G04_16330 [Actinoplanes sp. NPDC023801]|uniref:hypothetical protein n=1 Tax=Actinoplanes sp. NPDC023801 TaxID=3154595 RepID=UPI0033F60FCA